jgi:hypothetical protein
MSELNYLAIIAAGLAVFVFAATYYSVLAAQYAALSPAAAAVSGPSPWLMAFELVKALGVALVVAALVASIGITDLAGAALLGLALWVAFPVVLLAGSVMHEGVAVKLAALHAGDWLAKLLMIAVITAVWR